MRIDDVVPGRSAATRGLLVSHRGERCGVHQFGRRLFEILASAEGIAWEYAECDSADDLFAAERLCSPDLILLNYHPATLAWATQESIAACGAPLFSVFHEANQTAADLLEPQPFDYLLCPDPTLLPRNPIALAVPRFIPPLYTGTAQPPDIFTIGSFGFATPDKGFGRLCALVCEQFDTAIIRINIPFHDNEAMVPRAQLEAVVAECRAAITKPGVRLDITHTFFDNEELLAFLASNTINAFLYEGGEGRGISSCTDYALASMRPLAVSHSPMFRHLHGINPSICAEDRSLRAIADAGSKPLRHHRRAYARDAAGAAWNQAILEALAQRALSAGVPDGRGLNKRLDDRSRRAYTNALSDLHRLAPEMVSRKIPEANIQQAFALDTAERIAASHAAPRMLAVGSFEDTAVAALHAKGYRIDEVDPNVNGETLEDFYRAPAAVLQSYDIILSVSVLEHVEDDRRFVRMLADLLAPGGTAILTVDFSNRYPELGDKPNADHRLYTTHDLRERLMSAIPDCALLDRPSWDDGHDDFEYEGCHYSFASWVFRKLPARHRRYLIEPAIAAGAPWKEQLTRMTADLGATAAKLEAADGTVGRLQATIAWMTTEAAAAEAELAAARAEQQKLRIKLIATQTEVQAQQARINALIPEVRIWRRLVRELRLEEGPKALRLVLPAARIVRLLNRTPVPPEFDPMATAVVTGPPVPASPAHAVVPSNDAPTPPFHQTLKRRLVLPLYLLVRPIVRPIVWRFRGFMGAEVAEQMRRLSAQVETTQRHVAERIDTMAHQIASTANPTHTEMRRLGVEIERILLTLAMEREPDVWSSATLPDPSAATQSRHVPPILPPSLTQDAEKVVPDMPPAAEALSVLAED